MALERRAPTEESEFYEIKFIGHRCEERVAFRKPVIRSFAKGYSLLVIRIHQIAPIRINRSML